MLMLQSYLMMYGNLAKAKAKKLFLDDKGDVNIVSIVVLIGIAVVLALVFRDAIEKLLTQLLAQITGNALEATQKSGGN